MTGKGLIDLLSVRVLSAKCCCCCFSFYLWKGGGVSDYERVYYTKSNSLAFINSKVKDPWHVKAREQNCAGAGLKLFITLCIL